MVNLPTPGELGWADDLAVAFTEIETKADDALAGVEGKVDADELTVALTAERTSERAHQNGTYVDLTTGSDTARLAGRAPVRTPSPVKPLQKVGRVLPVGAAGEFDAALVESPAIFWDPISQRWGMLYVAYTQAAGNNGGLAVAVAGSLGLAWSDDLITWEKQGQVIAGSGSGGDASGCSGGKVVYDDGTWHLFYIGLATPGYEGVPTLCHASTTEDPADWTPSSWTRSGTIVGPSGSGWRQAKMYVTSTPVRVDGTWYFFLNGADNAGTERIGLMTAPDLAGPYTVRDDLSPVLDVGAAASWDEFIVGDPGVFRDGDVWWMSYYGASAGAGSASDGWAFTTAEDFPVGWTKHSANPILPTGPAGSFDSAYAHKPFILRLDGARYHFYTAEDGTHRSIGLAVAYPAPQFARARWKTSAVTTGYIYNTGGAWAEIDNGMRLDGIAAQPGDVIEVGMSGVWANQAVDGLLDAKLLASGVYVGAGSTDASQNGVGAWYRPGSIYAGFGGSAFYTLADADIAADGTIAVSPQIKTSGSRELLSTPGTRFHFWCRNHGRLV